MVIYTARQEVLNLSKTRLIWPKELQLISRQTDKQAQKLAKLYKKMDGHRVEPFAEDTTVPCESGESKARCLVVDLTKQTAAFNGTLVSPKASVMKEQYSSEKK